MQIHIPRLGERIEASFLQQQRVHRGFVPALRRWRLPSPTAKRRWTRSEPNVPTVRANMRTIEVFEDALPQSLFSRLVHAVEAVGREGMHGGYSTTLWFLIGAPPANIAEECIVKFKAKFGGEELHLVRTLDYIYDSGAYAHYMGTEVDGRFIARCESP